MMNCDITSLLLWMFAATCVSSQEDTKVDYIFPNYGGVNGQTKVTIFGQDFDTTLTLERNSPRIEVKFVSPFNEYPCLVHDAERDENQIVCYTVPMQEGEYYIRLITNGIPLDLKKYCGGSPNSWRCRIRIRSFRTPNVYGLSWQSNEPRSFITVRGRLFTNLTTSSQAEATNGLSIAITRVWVTSGVCQLYNKTTQLPFGITLDGDEGQSYWGNLQCMIESSYVGSQNLSFIVNNDYGRSSAYRRTKRISADNKLYMLQTYAVITDVNPKIGSTAGGTLLTISGRHFDTSSGIEARVYVSGVACDVQTVTSSEITCVTPPEPLKQPSYSGGRGIRVEIFPEIVDFSTYLNVSTEGYDVFFAEDAFLDRHIINQNSFTSRTKGFFVPSVDAEYVFSVEADDHIELYFNEEGNSAAEAKRLTFSYQASRVNVTKSLSLRAGVEYYYELRHIEFGGHEYIQLGAHVSKTSYTTSQSESVITDVQNIVISSTVTKEVQKIKFHNWTMQTPVHSVWLMEVTCLNESAGCFDDWFTIELLETRTGPVMIGSTADDFNAAISALPLLGDDSVAVEQEEDNVFRVTFTTDRGRMQLSVQSSDESSLIVVAEEEVVGEAKLDTITFQVNGLSSDPIPFDAAESQVGDVIMGLFGSSCSDEIGPGIGRSRKYFDMESESVPSGHRTSSTSFCGSYSLTNPNYLFRDEEQPYRLSTYKHVCFAYTGDIDDRFYISYTYTEDTGEGGSHTLRSFRTVGLVQSDEKWRHYCYNLYDRLHLDNPNARNIEVSAVYIRAGSNPDMDHYVDNIFIGQVRLSQAQIDAVLSRIIPPAVPSIRLQSVDVVKTDTDYEVTFHPIDCGHSFPLLARRIQLAPSEMNTNLTSVTTDGLRTVTPEPIITQPANQLFLHRHNGTVVTPRKQKVQCSIPCCDTLTLQGFSFTTSRSEISSNAEEFTFGPEEAKITVERISEASPPVEGTFGIAFEDSNFITLRDLPADISADMLKNELETLMQIESVEVSRSGTCYGYSWNVKFLSPGGSYPLMKPVDENLVSSPQPANITVDKEENGGLNMNPIPGDFLRTAHDVPQVQVFINDVPSHCLSHFESNMASCDFNWLTSSTPYVSTINPSSGSPGQVIEMTGINFAEIPSGNQVLIGGLECVVTTSDSTSLTCTLGNSPTGVQPLVLNVAGKGLAGNKSLTFQVSGSVDGIAPTSGSLHGCLNVTISGKGFDASSAVQIKGSTCRVYEVTYDVIRCITGPASVGSGTVDVTTSEVTITSSFQFDYVDTNTGSVDKISQLVFSVKGEDTVNITGRGFGSDPGQVYFGTTSVSDFISWSDTEIVFLNPPLPSGDYSVDVVVPSLGCSANSPTVQYEFTVSDRSPGRGSLSGGTSVTISGSGFTEDMIVKFGEVVCEDVALNEAATSLTCITQSASKTHVVSNSGRHPSLGIGYAWSPSTLDIVVGDSVTFAWSVPKQVTGVHIGLFTTLGASGMDYDEDGFSVTAASSGKHTFTFNDVGRVHYASGCLDDDCDVIMRGVINVREATNVVGTLSARIGDVEAEYTPNEYSFTFDTSRTPIVRSIEPRQGTTETLITISGDGFVFGAKVTVGEKACDTKSRTTTVITCKIDKDEELPIETYHEVVVSINNRGVARNEIRNVINRTFVLLPLVTSVSPAVGSLAGGTEVTIQGSGFNNQFTVHLAEWFPCELIETTYTSIKCISTAVTSASSAAVKVVSPGKSEAQCATTCSYEYSQSATPNVTSWSHNGEWNNLEIVFIGNGFGRNFANVDVSLVRNGMRHHCDVTALDDSKLECNIQRFPVGENEIHLLVQGKGLALFVNSSSSITSPNLIDTISPATGSLNGGTRLTITGNGFVRDNTQVTIGGVACLITDTDLSSISCTTAAGEDGDAIVKVTSGGINYPQKTFTYSEDATPEVTSISSKSGVGGDVVTLTGTLFGSSTSNVTVTIGDVSCDVSSVSNTSLACTLGSREGGSAAIQVHVAGRGIASIRANFTYVLSATSVSPSEGSYGGSQVLTIDGEGFSPTTTVHICGNICSITSQTPTQLECMTPSNKNRVAERTDCDVMVSNRDSNVTLSSSYTYASSITAVISDVTPSRGGTGGGTMVTITGSGFGLTPLVEIDGSVCDVASSSNSEIVCHTNQHRGSVQAKVEVKTGNKGIAFQESADFFYVDRWSSIFTWGGTTLPVDQDFVIIQKGQTVLLDTDTAVMKMLLIDGGELIFDEKDVTLNAENILITNGGRLQVGTEEAPFQSNANIVMYGNLRSPELPIYGAKTLALRDGTLDLHGRHISHPWTKLATTANAGATQITLEQAVDWKVGDRIVIASTGLRHSQSENEERSISDISGDGFTLTLSEALEYQHLGVTKVFDGVSVEFRAEVGLLSRNIVFRGSNNHVWNDDIPKCEEGFDTGMFATQTCFQGRFGEEVGSDQFGASIMMHTKTPNSPDTVARVENIEITYAGQAFRLGRYPIHWHLMGDATGHYVRRCSIHKTFNRAVTIHGTHNLTVDSNVLYDVMGGAIFIEDGIETGNIIQYNLAVFVRQSTSLLNDDVTPAAYWVTNPDNIIQHNHAAGGTHFGFWYRMHEHPDGPSFTPDVCQQHVELGRFENNTVHSQGWFGLWIFESYFPMEGGRCDSTVPSPAKFKSLTTWNCEKGAEWVNCGAIQFIDFIMVDNEVAGIEAKLVKNTPWGAERGALIDNALIVGHSDEASLIFETQVGIILPMAPGLLIRDTSFINFNRGGVALGGTTIQGVCVSNCGGFYFMTEGLSFTSVTKKLVWRWLHEGVIVDRDGSLTEGKPMSKVVPFSDIMDPTLCPKSTGDIFSSNPEFPSAICEPQVRFHRLALNNPKPSSLEGNKLFVSNRFGNTSSTYYKKRLTHKPGWMLLLQSKEDYLMWFDDGEQFTNITYDSKYYDLFEDDYLFITHQLKQTPDVVAFNGEARSIENATTISSSSNNLDWVFLQESKRLKFIVSGKTSSRNRRAIEIVDENYTHVAVQPTIYRCLYANCIGPANPDEIPPTREKPEDFVLWSDESNPCLEWIDDNTVFVKRSVEGNGSLPAIELCWVVVDVDSIIVDNITIEGVLHFENKDVDVSAIYIMVQGGRVIAGFSNTEHFSNKLTITLRGNQSTTAWALPGVELGAKALGCFGGCDFHGKFHDVYWTHLEETAMAGKNTIVLVDAVDWTPGDEIVIATTGYRSDETEKHIIQSIEEDKRTITLSEPLLHRHLGESYSIGTWQLPMRAEVGLLSRNIKIIGERYDGIEEQGFGARVLVGTTKTAAENTIWGWGRFTDVEFVRTGQLGWTDPWDPRFSLAWVDTGATSPARPSFVKGCAFHDGYATAIGLFGADDITISHNVIHRAIHDGIRITGSGHRLERNLVAMTLFRDSYGDRFEPTNFLDWPASFQLTEANQPVLIGNTAAGSERFGFHFNGEACDAPEENAWRDNTAHSCLHGIHIFKEDGVGTCSMIRNFIIYKAWDFGIYHQTQVSIVVRNTIIADSTVGYFPMIFQPLAQQHQYAEKSATMEDVLCVGRSDHFDPTIDFMDEATDKNLLIRSARPSRKAPLTPTGGKMCVMLPLFQSGPNGAPFKPFHSNMDYPAIHGGLTIKGLHAHNYKAHDGKRDLIFFTNPDNEDAYHPTSMSKVILTNVEEESKIYLARPSLGKINPSDCVDMECDGKKKVLVVDEDGGFLGEPGAVIPQAEFGWDDDKEMSRGLGDYRIPKTMLSATDGSRFDADDIADARGIIRSEACTYKDAWQAYDCHGNNTLNYRMLVMESMDDDSETRRISPVALLGNGYLDLNNGPQDHGWCFGYTCQLRLSTFYTIVAIGNHFTIFFTGATPRGLRLHLLNVDDTESIRIAICLLRWHGVRHLLVILSYFNNLAPLLPISSRPMTATVVNSRYSKPERLDIKRDQSGKYIQPENAVYNVEEEFWDLRPVTAENKDSFKPAIDSNVNGANFFDVTTQLLYVTVRGSEPVVIETAPAIIVAFSVPAISVDDFFEKNLIDNLAKFLKVPPYKIRIVSVVRETSARRRREVNNSTAGEEQTITAMITDEVRTSSTTNSTTSDQLTPEELNVAASTLLETFQNGSMSDAINTTVSGFASTKAVVNATIENLEEPTTTALVSHKIPRKANISWTSAVVEEYLEISPPLILTLLTEEDEVVPEIGGSWLVAVQLLRDLSDADPDAILLGETRRMFSKGMVDLTDLSITHEGSYRLACDVIKTSGDIFDSREVNVTVVRRLVHIAVTDQPDSSPHRPEDKFSYGLELRNSNNQLLENINHKGLIWEGHIILDDSMNYGDTRIENGSVSFEITSPKMMTPSFMLLNTEANVSYHLILEIQSTPPEYEFSMVLPPIQFIESEKNTTDNNTTEPTEPPVVVGPPELNCPMFETATKCNQRSQWLCEYIRWKIDFSLNWRRTFNKWRIAANWRDVFSMEETSQQCHQLEVKCKNVDKWGEVEDSHGCSLPYCLDGYYESGPRLSEWKRDQNLWRKMFKKWEELLKELNTVNSEDQCL